MHILVPRAIMCPGLWWAMLGANTVCLLMASIPPTLRTSTSKGTLPESDSTAGVNVMLPMFPIHTLHTSMYAGFLRTSAELMASSIRRWASSM